MDAKPGETGHISAQVSAEVAKDILANESVK